MKLPPREVTKNTRTIFPIVGFRRNEFGEESSEDSSEDSTMVEDEDGGEFR